jgi:type I restriction enzyme R subunit
VDKNFQAWVFQKQAGTLKFTRNRWLAPDDEGAYRGLHPYRKGRPGPCPFDADGGLGRMWQLFGDKTDKMIDEINEALAA